MKNYDIYEKLGYILDIEIEYPKNLINFHSVLPFVPERIKIKECHKLVCNLHDENEYVHYIKPPWIPRFFAPHSPVFGQNTSEYRTKFSCIFWE